MKIYDNNSVQTVFPISKTCSTCKSILGVEKADIFFTADVTGSRPEGRKAYICLCCGYQNAIDAIVSTAPFEPNNTKFVSVNAAPAPAETLQPQ